MPKMWPEKKEKEKEILLCFAWDDFPVLTSRKCPQAESWTNLRAHLIFFFFFLLDHSPVLPIFQCTKIILIFFFQFLVAYSMKTVIPAWTNVEVLFVLCKLSRTIFLALSNKELQNKHPKIQYGSTNRAKYETPPKEMKYRGKIQGCFYCHPVSPRELFWAKTLEFCLLFGFHSSEKHWTTNAQEQIEEVN